MPCRMGLLGLLVGVVALLALKIDSGKFSLCRLMIVKATYGATHKMQAQDHVVCMSRHV